MASNGVEALAAYERHSDPIDLVMTDIMMPVLSGRQLAEQLREQQPALKVLFMSGYSDDASVRNGDFAVETDFIPKPFLPDALAKKVRELLDRP